jgi:signal transduction histidine kinase
MGVFRLPVVRAPSARGRLWLWPASGPPLSAGQRTLLAALVTIAALGGTLLAARALRTESPLLTPLLADVLWLALMAAMVLGQRSSARLPPALLAGGPLFALGWAGPPTDALLWGLFGTSLVVGGLLLDGRWLLLLAGWYFLLYLLATLHREAGFVPPWDELAAPLVALAAVTIGTWGSRCAWRAGDAARPGEPLQPPALSRAPNFLAHLAHQVRAPLALLRGAIQQALAEPTLSAERTRAVLLEVDHAAARLSRLVDDLLLLARAERNTPLVAGRVEVLTLVESVYEQARRWPGGERLQLAIGEEWVDGDWAVRGDSQLLQQLLLNLIDNALKYSGPTAPVRLRLAADRHQVRIAVEDSGAPIPRVEQAQIFQQFYRGAAARHAGVPGSGLGLSIAQWIARLHGGEVALVELGVGKAFELRLPASDAPPWITPRE